MKNKKIQRIIVIVLCFVSLQNIYAQNNYDLQQKYWVYRKRFFDKFIITNTAPDPGFSKHGFNIPAGSRYYDGYKITWGDGGIYLAQYIMVLATEYKLLKNNGQNYAETQSLLVAALNTFNRLDFTAEGHFRKELGDAGYFTYPSDMNGFFIRDDVDLNFWNMYGANYFEDGSVNYFQSDFYNTENNIYTKECSIDQMWHIILAMALVKNLVDNTPVIFDGYESNGPIGIVDMTRIITDKMIVALNYTNSWELVNPVTNDLVHRGAYVVEGVYPLDTRYRKYGFAKAADLISPDVSHNLGNAEDAINDNFTEAIKSPYPLHNYAKYHIYDFATIIGDVFNQSLLTVVWGYTFGNLYNKYEATYSVLLKVVKNDHYYEHFPLIFRLLHNNQGDFSGVENDMEFSLSTYLVGLLKTAPDCGPYYMNGSYPDYNWSSSSRVTYPENLGGSFANGEYNGLDYMLLYNLYQLNYGNTDCSTVPNNMNWLNLEMTFPWYWNGQIYGTIGYPGLSVAKQTIEFQGTMESDAVMTFVAGQKITIKPPMTLGHVTHIKNGAKFKAYINDVCSYHSFNYNALYTCSGNASTVRLFQDTITNNNGKITDNSDSKIILLTHEGDETKELLNNNDHHVYHTISTEGRETTLNNTITENLANNFISNKQNTKVTYIVSIFPNPNTGKFLIEINGAVPANTTVELKDLLGKTVYNSSILQNSNSIDLTESPAGIYFITVCAGKDCWLGKVVKE